MYSSAVVVCVLKWLRIGVCCYYLIIVYFEVFSILYLILECLFVLVHVPTQLYVAVVLCGAILVELAKSYLSTVRCCSVGPLPLSDSGPTEQQRTVDNKLVLILNATHTYFAVLRLPA